MWAILKDNSKYINIWQNYNNGLDIYYVLITIFNNSSLLLNLIKINFMSTKTKKRKVDQNDISQGNASQVIIAWSKLDCEDLLIIQENMKGKNNRKKIGEFINAKFELD